MESVSKVVRLQTISEETLTRKESPPGPKIAMLTKTWLMTIAQTTTLRIWICVMRLRITKTLVMRDRLDLEARIFPKIFVKRLLHLPS